MSRASSFPNRIILTGGRGSLAAVVASRFEGGGSKVDRYSRTEGDGFRPLPSLFEPEALRGADTLMHLAWSTVPFSAEQAPPGESAQDLRLLEQLLDRLAALPERERPHFVFFSSGGTVYGNGQPGRAHREDDVCAPIGRHGKAKLAAEKLIERHAAASGLAWTILRIGNPYGFPVPSGRPQGIIPAAINAARNGTGMTLWGDGSAQKDFLHYSDFAKAVEAVAVSRAPGVYNVGSGETHSIREILALVEAATGRRIAVTHRPAYPWDVQHSMLDSSLLRAKTGWEPQVPLREGIERMVAASVAA